MSVENGTKHYCVLLPFQQCAFISWLKLRMRKREPQKIKILWLSTPFVKMAFSLMMVMVMAAPHFLTFDFCVKLFPWAIWTEPQPKNEAHKNHTRHYEQNFCEQKKLTPISKQIWTEVSLNEQYDWEPVATKMSLNLFTCLNTDEL